MGKFTHNDLEFNEKNIYEIKPIGKNVFSSKSVGRRTVKGPIAPVSNLPLLLP
jgi:hypothetical protein